MKNMTESRMQGWRAVAVGNDGVEHLVFVGMSYEQVKKNYASAFLAILTPEEQSNIKHIQMQRWIGVADSGRWTSQEISRIPTAKRVEAEEDTVLEATDVELQSV